MLCVTGFLIAAFAGAAAGPEFPRELVEFVPYEHNPVFTAAGNGAWDESIRERGWILREDGGYHLWYTGYAGPYSSVSKLGYATSPDGIAWTRYSGNPIYTERWVEDMTVVKRGGTYYMFAEGRDDRAQLLVSTDRVNWTYAGDLDIRKADGSPIAPGPFGTPAVLFEDGTWYLFYERNDEAIWLASSPDLKVWTNVQDAPVIERGPDPYDQTMIAVNQVLAYKGRYYAYYHATGPNSGNNRWNLSIATSTDKIHWTKYPRNPVIPEDHSSGLLVDDGTQLRLYCMHPEAWLYYPKK